MPIKQLVVRVSVDVSESDYGASLSHASTKFKLDEENGMGIPTDNIGESARTMTRQAFELPAVGAAYDALATIVNDDPLKEARENPEAPGPGYDSQTRPTNNGK